MKGLDTNVLLRLFVDDEPEQADRAEAFIRQTYESGSLCYVNKIVLCEFVWVLARGYDCERAVVADALESLLSSPQFRIEDEPCVRSAARAYRDGLSDFADHLIDATNRAAGCERTATFDRRAARLDGFEPL